MLVKLFVGNLPWSVSDDDLARVFSPHGEVQSARVITDRDIAIRAVAEGCDANTRVSEIMSEGVEYCFQDDDLDEAQETMRDKQVQHCLGAGVVCVPTALVRRG